MNEATATRIASSLELLNGKVQSIEKHLAEVKAVEAHLVEVVKALDVISVRLRELVGATRG